ncbi:MAG: hypothetical protein JNJ75_10635 [Cyclobacteriaceae bacterium]|nr:hypothetical protein [Cyclobacteriaceae bacterium]
MISTLKAAFALCIICAAINLHADAQLAIPEPEFYNSVTVVVDGKPAQLEKQKVIMRTSRNASAVIVGIGKVKVLGSVKGERSPVRITKTDTLRFLVRVADNTKDPATVINFARFEINKDRKSRFIEVESAQTFSADTQRDNVDFIQFKAAKYGLSSYLITVINLLPGEYMITLDGSRELCQMFGIDEINAEKKSN